MKLIGVYVKMIFSLLLYCSVTQIYFEKKNHYHFIDKIVYWRPKWAWLSPIVLAYLTLDRQLQALWRRLYESPVHSIELWPMFTFHLKCSASPLTGWWLRSAVFCWPTFAKNNIKNDLIEIDIGLWILCHPTIFSWTEFGREFMTYHFIVRCSRLANRHLLPSKMYSIRNMSNSSLLIASMLQHSMLSHFYTQSWKFRIWFWKYCGAKTKKISMLRIWSTHTRTHSPLQAIFINAVFL